MELQNIQAAADARACFTISADEFHAAAKLLASRVIERRNTLPILAHIRIAADLAGTVTLAACNLDQWASVTLAAVVEAPGVICIDGGALADALAKGRKGAFHGQVTLRDNDGRAELSAGRSCFKLASLPADEFPADPAPIGEAAGEATLAVEFSLPAAQLLSDIATLAPCIHKESSERYYLQGIAMQRRDMAGRDCLVMAACDGSNIAAASRPLPAGAQSMPDMILPGGAVAMLKAAAKLESGADLATLRMGDAGGMGAIVVQLGRFTLCSKAIDGTFPEWQRLFDRLPAPTGEETAPMFPELLPGAPTGAIEKMRKACPVAIEWEACGDIFMGIAPADPGLLFSAMRCEFDSTGVKGFSFNVTGEADARAYLVALAETRGLPSPDEMLARCDAINAAYGEPDNDAYNGRRAFGRAEPVAFRLVQRGARILGLTIAGEHKRAGWSETVTDWETLCERSEYHPETVEPVEGSYSLLMPADGPGTLSAHGMGEIIGPDGVVYPVADNGRAIHLTKDQVRALMDGPDAWAVVEFPGPDGKPRYVSKWLWEQGDSVLGTVQANGRTFPEKRVPGAWRWVSASESYSRAEIETALAGEVIPAAPMEVKPAPIVGSEAPATAPEMAAVGPVAPPAAVTGPEPVAIAPETPGTGQDGAGEAPADPVAAILARLDALEAAIAAPLPVESGMFIIPASNEGEKMNMPPIAAIQRLHRTPAHERAVRRAWAERKARRTAERQTMLAERDADYQRNLRDVARGQLESQEAMQSKGRAMETLWACITGAQGSLARMEHRRRASAGRARRMIAAARHAARVERQRADVLAAQLDKAGHDLGRATAKRAGNAALARQRGREMVAIANVARNQLDRAAADLEAAKRAPVYMDEAGREAPDIVGRTANHARTAIEGRQRAENALAAMAARAERAEAARDTLADAVEAMGLRLANAEAAVRRMAAA